jgi:hypothetical protein
MNNEPVVWTVCLDCGKRFTGDSIHTCSPQLKTLTDGEILNMYLEQTNGNKDLDILEFARAILKKASEK